MIAVHLMIAGMQTDWATAFVEMTASRLSGVTRVFGVKSLGILSVMFDETKASAEQIVQAIRAAGFEAEIYRPNPALAAG